MTTITPEHNLRSFSFQPGGIASLLRSKGKFTTVYKGIADDNHSPVVIKELNNSLSNDQSALAKFKNEFRLNIQHPGIVQTLGYSFTGNKHYIIREFVPGKDLKEVIRKNKSRPDVVVRYLIDLLDALAALHENNILHTDIRPANIIINEATGKAMLSDLGLARLKDESSVNDPFALIYSPPEQVLQRASLLNESSDLYSLAITFYEAFCGEPAFDHENPQLLMHLQITRPLVSDKKIPAPIFEVLKKASAKYPLTKPPSMYSKDQLNELLKQGMQMRYQSATEMKSALLGAIRSLF